MGFTHINTETVNNMAQEALSIYNNLETLYNELVSEDSKISDFWQAPVATHYEEGSADLLANLKTFLDNNKSFIDNLKATCAVYDQEEDGLVAVVDSLDNGSADLTQV